ncbi:uncharacterized protein N0V89_001199 [Didymosphaeria variabile]|uniref:Uncharacterized protein n=1 Tax=Didymosphaeria variabile TaxID=1932322 RepID=A0A9W9CFN7_9PLEO|nr:uncharacterized protein N0V89_001199 [Didymosphaeria variabile]KAJ4360633.1 hypothetical protein N0V89_001199 [Didymosphaeria variabile]
MHSSRWSAPPAEDESEAESEGPWAPPAWQNHNNKWYRKSYLQESSPSKSRTASPYEQRFDREVTPSRIPLPESPRKGTPRTSPEPVEQRHFTPDTIASRLQSPSIEPDITSGAQQHPEEEGSPRRDGFIRVVFKSESLVNMGPLEERISSFSRGMSKTRVCGSLVVLVLAWLLIHPWGTETASPGPNVAHLVSMVRRFEPLLYASENVIPRSRELSDASIAVEDLGESIRASNMSGSKVIVTQLDGLSENLKTLSQQIQTFFVHVDGDMDGTISAIGWATRQLEGIQGSHVGVLDTVIGNVHGGLSKIGLLGTDDQLSAVGSVVTGLMGSTTQQKAKAALQRSFDFVLSTLEENLQNELSRADSLFQMFDNVDLQFHNLHRTVAKEEDTLSAQKDEFLASMWRTTITNKLRLKKYEKNLKLLKTLRSSALANKSELKNNIQIIRAVQDQLVVARKSLISPVIRGAQSDSYSIEKQLEDVVATHDFLQGIRDSQKHKFTKQLFAAPSRPAISITTGRDDDEEAEY